MIELLISLPEMDDSDLRRGLGRSINTFHLYMPGGTYSDNRDLSPKAQRICGAIDEILGKDGIAEATGLRARAGSLFHGDTGIKYLKLCVKVFNVLLQKGFPGEELWK